MKNINRIVLTTLLFIGSTSPSLSLAADGTEGTTSTGTSLITLTIPEIVQITNVGALSQTWNGNTGFNQNDNVCVYSNMDTGIGTNDYSVTATGSYDIGGGAVAGLRVGNTTTTDSIVYSVFWNDEAGTTNETDISSAPATSQTGWTNDVNCGGGNNANFHVTMTNAAIGAVQPGVYTGTLSLLITPTP